MSTLLNGRIYHTRAARLPRHRRFWRAARSALWYLLVAVLVGIGVAVAVLAAFGLAVFFLLVKGD